MRPVLFDILGFPINSYGVSKALAALVAAYLLGREFRRLGWDPERAWNLVMASTVLGFAGGKLYYLAEHAGNLTLHDFGSSGFTWYGGMIAGVATVVVMTRRYRLPLGQFAGIVAAHSPWPTASDGSAASWPGTALTASPRTFPGRWPSRTGRCRRWSRSTPPRYMNRRSRSC